MSLARPGSVRTVDDMLGRIHAAPAPVPVGSVGISGDLSVWPGSQFGYNGALGDASRLTDIRRPLKGIGFTGRLPPGALLLGAPLEQRAVLAELVNSVAASTDKLLDFSRLLFAAIGPGSAYRRSPIVPPLFMLAPGDTIEFPELLSAGVTVAPVSPWYGVCSGSSPDPCAIGLVPGILGNMTGREPVPTPLVRCFGAAVPDRVAFQRAASTHFTTGGVTATSGVYVGGAGVVSIHFCDDAVPLVPIVGVETGAFEVYWLGNDGVWHHNDSDDFDAAGRGVVTRGHDVETFVVPNWAAAVSIVQVSGNSFNAFVSLGWGDT